MSATMRVLETGKAQYILVWIQVELENTLKNLSEKVYCEHNTQKGANDHFVDGYFKTVKPLHSVNCGSRNLNLSTKAPEEKKIIFKVERACESGNFQEITTDIQDTPDGGIRQHFNDVMKKRNYRGEKIAAGFLYVSASTDFIVFVNNLLSGSL